MKQIEQIHWKLCGTLKKKKKSFSYVLPCLSLTDNFRISSSKQDVDPHVVEVLHSPFRGLPEWLILKALYIWTDKTSLCCRKLSTKILAFNTKFSKPFKLKKPHTCIWGECLHHSTSHSSFAPFKMSLFFFCYIYIFMYS